MGQGPQRLGADACELSRPETLDRRARQSREKPLSSLLLPELRASLAIDRTSAKVCCVVARRD